MMSAQQNQTNVVNEQHSIIGVESNSPKKVFQRTTHPEAQWFASPNFGLFIHWGISSVEGTGDLSWSMMARGRGTRKIAFDRYGFPAVTRTMTPRQYWDQAKHFNPDDYDPIKWLTAAKEAGCSYAVFTTKHHDGFAMWPSEQGDLSTRNYMQGRDLVGEYVDACRKVGLKVGFYYSPPDWYFNRDQMSFHYDSKNHLWDIDHQPMDAIPSDQVRDSEASPEFRAYIKGQVEELLTRYGKVDMLWFDGSAHDAISIERIHELQPHILINPRGHGVGDFATCECAFPKDKPQGWWEYCHIFNDGAWGYLNHEIYKPSGWALSELCKAYSWEGSFLLNVGPDAHGRLPEVCYARLLEIGQWLKRFGHTLINISKGPWPEASNMPVGIASQDKWFVYMPFDMDDVLVIDDSRDPKKVIRVDSMQEVQWTRNEQGKITITVPPTQRSLLVDVLQIDW